MFKFCFVVVVQAGLELLILLGTGITLFKLLNNIFLRLKYMVCNVLLEISEKSFFCFVFWKEGRGPCLTELSAFLLFAFSRWLGLEEIHWRKLLTSFASSGKILP
jgi:hypothetical protein